MRVRTVYQLEQQHTNARLIKDLLPWIILDETYQVLRQARRGRSDDLQSNILMTLVLR